MGFVGGAGCNAYGGWVGPRRCLLFFAILLLLIIFVNLIIFDYLYDFYHMFIVFVLKYLKTRIHLNR